MSLISREAPLQIETDVHPGIRFLTFNNPATKNALTLPVAAAYQRELANIKGDPDARVIVLGAKGDCFSAGGDFQFLEDRHLDAPERNRVVMKRFYELYLQIRDLNLPIVAAVSGHAIGAGLALALAADLRIVAARAKLGLTFVGLGLHPGMGATFFAERAVGTQRATWALLTGAKFSGEEATAWGMFMESLPQEEVVERAVQIANQMAHQSPQAIKTTLRTLRRRDADRLESALWQEALGQSNCYGHHDFGIGLDAVRNKKKPKYP